MSNISAIALRKIALGVFFISPVAMCASFNCADAKTGAEKAICANATVSLLDEKLGSAYSKASSKVEEPGLLRDGQRVWLRTVWNKCRSEECFQTAAVARLDELAKLKRFEWKKFVDAEQGFEFSYPTNLRIEKSADGPPNIISLLRKGVDPAKDTVNTTLEVCREDLATTAKSHSLFQGRSFEPTVPEASSGPGWRRLQATVLCGWSDEAGFHSGGECLHAAISNGSRTVVFESGGSDVPEWVPRVLGSIKFLKK